MSVLSSNTNPGPASHIQQNAYEDVRHGQFVLTIPRRFRQRFRSNRELLSDLSRCASRTIQNVDGFAVDKTDRPGGPATIQTFGPLMLWNPHIHMIVTDGAFDGARRFHPMPKTSTEPF